MQYFPSLAKISALSETGGTITLADSHIRIGGNGYQTGSLDLAVGTATANTLYMIYAVRDSGSTILVKSTNYNSVGPASYDSWKLVGAFYTAAANTFGSFVNIEGSPQSEFMPFTSTWNQTMGTNSAEQYQLIRRNGQIMEIRLRMDGNAGGTNDSVALQMDIPWGLTGDRKLTGSSDEIIGTGVWSTSGSAYGPNRPAITDTDSTILEFLNTQSSGAYYKLVRGDSFVASRYGEWQMWIPIVEWNNTPLVDL